MNLYAWNYYGGDLIIYTKVENPTTGTYIYDENGVLIENETIPINDYGVPYKLVNTVGSYTANPETEQVYSLGIDGIYRNGSGIQMMEFMFDRDAEEDISNKFISKFKHNNVTYTIKDAKAREDILTKQDILISGTNIKSINNTSILNSGNLDLANAIIYTTDSGDTLPDPNNYELWDTFLNTTNNKLYTTIIDYYELKNTTNNSVQFDTATGMLSGFRYTGNSSQRVNYGAYIEDALGWTGNKYYRLSFILDSEPDLNTKYSIYKEQEIYDNTHYNMEVIINAGKLNLRLSTYNVNTSVSTDVLNVNICSTDLELNTQYYLEITKTGNSAYIVLSTGWYSKNIIETNTVEVVDNYPPTFTSKYTCYGMPFITGQTYYGSLYPFSIGKVYLGYITGDPVNVYLNWNNGAALENDREYLDKTNSKLYFFKNNKLITVSGSGGDSLPDQTGQSGKFLTTDGTNPSWATVSAGDSLPDQTGQAGKFLTTNGTDASWAEVQSNSSTITYFDSTNWTLDSTNTTLITGLSLGNNVNVFKNGQLLQPGAFNSVSTTVGNPTIQNGISSNMNTSNYVRFLRADYLLDNDWEIFLKIYWDGSSNNIYASISDYATANYLRIESSGGFSFNGYLTNNNSVWVHHASCFHYKPAGWYYISLKYTYSTGDFAIYSGTSPDDMVRNAHVEKGEHMQLRNLTSSKYVFSQSPFQIDLKESYVKVGEDKYPIIFKNDYIVNGNNINFTDELESTDKVAVINGDMNPIQSVGYNTFSNKSILATDWVADNTYSGYSYKCDIPCTGVTSTMYAQVTFAPAEAMSGNYANICDTGTGVVTIYSKVAEALTIPMIMVLGV